ncbi:MAG TPA: hypothetical protein VK571_10985 [Gemmatimonadaceae bacterium]|nr:hypothetical protein [Gemmatimonadaceae bacterium]
MPKDNLRHLRPLLALLVIPDAHHACVTVRGDKTMTADAARCLAMELLYAADEAEGDEVLGAFGYDADDSKALGELRMLIDEELGWGGDEQECDGDYEARVRQVGEILRRKLRVVKP